VASRGTSYHSAVSKRFLGRSVSDTGPNSQPLEGVDNLSFFSFEGGEDMFSSLQSEATRPGASVGPSVTTTSPDVGLSKEGNSLICGGSHLVYLGCILILLTGCLHTTTTSLPPLLSTTVVDPWLLLLCRSVLQLCISLLLVAVLRICPLGPPGYRWRLYLVSLVCAGLVLSLYLSLTRLPAPEVGSLLGVTPILTVLLSTLVTKEHLGLLRLLTCLLLISGVLLHSRPSLLFPELQADNIALTQFNTLGIPVTFTPPLPSLPSMPPPSPMDPLGYLAAITASLLSSILLLVMSVCRVSGSIHTTHILLWSSLGLTLVSSIGVLTQSQDTLTMVSVLPQSSWIMTVVVSLLGSLATTLLVVSLCWVCPGRTSLLLTASLLLNYAVKLLLDPVEELPSWPDLVGGVCLLLGLLCVGLEGFMVDGTRWKWL